MIKKIGSLAILLGNILFAQTNDLQKNNIINSPNYVEESNSKAIIKANLIDEYIQDYYTKTYYNKNGYISERDFFDESGNLILKETYSYNEKNQLIKNEAVYDNQEMIIIKDVEYFDNGYKEIISENDIIVKEIVFQINTKQQIISEKETDFINNGLETEKTNEYQGEKLIKSSVKFGKEGYIIQYKYDKNNPIEEVIFDLKNNLIQKKRRKFDDQNNIIEENLFDNAGKLKTNNRILYEFDDKGNWLKRTQFANKFEQPISNTIRTIKYY